MKEPPVFVNITKNETAEENKTQTAQISMAEVEAQFPFLFASDFILEEGSDLFKKVILQLQEVPYPVPLVVKFNSTGYVRIYFSKELLVPVPSERAEFVRLIMDEKFLELRLAATDYAPEEKGVPLFDLDLFQHVSLVVENDVSGRRLTRKLQTTPDQTWSHSFNWTIVHYDQQKMGI